MIKTYESRHAAVIELNAKGFDLAISGRFVSDTAIATVHPIPGKTEVRVAYVLRATTA